MKKSIYLFASLLLSHFAFAQCTDLFFSEYVEGSSNSKALEIFNPTATSISLAGYKIQLYTNGSTTPNTTFNLSGSIDSKDVYVVVNNGANDSIKARRDTISGVTNFNGNDAVLLLKGSDTLDAIGVVGVDPGAVGWVVGAGFTTDKTLTRIFSVTGGTKDWSLGATQWDVLPKDTIRLGEHTNGCGVVTDTMVRFSTSSISVNENAGTTSIGLQLNAISSSSTFSVDVELAGGTGDTSDIGNYTTQTITFAPNTATQNLTVTITNDTIVEGSETLIFKLRNSTAPLQIGADSMFTLTIGASDVPPAAVTIAQISSLNANLQPDSLGKPVEVTGTVYGVNMRLDSLQFTIQDATDGIQVVSYNSTFGYSVNEGDSVKLIGQVAFSGGMTQIEITDTLYKIGSGTLKTPVVVQDLDESTESQLVRLNNVTLVTPSQWGTGLSGYTCDITDGVGTWTMRIDAETDLFGTTAPTGNFNVIGLGGQFDNSSPYNSGYQILPRYAADIVLISGIENRGEVVQRIFPNPSSGQFFIQMSDVSNHEIALFDISGKQLMNVKSESKIIEIQTSELSNGVYFVEVKSGGSVSRKKIIVE